MSVRVGEIDDREHATWTAQIDLERTGTVPVGPGRVSRQFTGAGLRCPVDGSSCRYDDEGYAGPRARRRACELGAVG